jgi:hypothetical protein
VPVEWQLGTVVESVTVVISPPGQRLDGLVKLLEDFSPEFEGPGLVLTSPSFPFPCSFPSPSLLLALPRPSLCREATGVEILQKLSNSWTMFAFQLTISGVVFSFSLTSASRTGFLLILPIISYVVASQYLRNLHAIRELATYIRTELSPRVPGGLKWEEWHLHRPNDRSQYKVLSPPSVAFPGISLIALTLVLPYIISGQYLSLIDRWMLWALWVINLVLTILSLYMFQRIYRINLRLPGWIGR